MAEGKKPPDKKVSFKGFTEGPATSTPKTVVMPAKFQIPPGTKLEDVCTQCPVPLSNKTEGAFRCGFCHRYTHAKCTTGNFTVDEIKRIKDGELIFKCYMCEIRLPRKEPINAIIDESIPWQRLTSAERKLELAEKRLSELKKKIKSAEGGKWRPKEISRSSA